MKRFFFYALREAGRKRAGGGKSTKARSYMKIAVREDGGLHFVALQTAYLRRFTDKDTDAKLSSSSIRKRRMADQKGKGIDAKNRNLR